MISLLLAMALGGFMGFLLKKTRMAFLPVAVQIIICLLLFFLGLELGSDRSIQEKIGALCVKACVLTAGALFGSLLMAMALYHLHFKRFEGIKEQVVTPSGRWGLLKNSIAVFLSFLTGAALGSICFVASSHLTDSIVPILLHTLLFMVGVGVGKERDLFYSIRQQGLSFLLLPLCTLTGTLMGSALFAWPLPDMGIREGMAVGSGMGYYSLSSLLLTQSKGVEIGSIALISNVLRELFTLFTAPFLVRIFGPLSPISAGGVTSMDITLPAIIRASGSKYAPLAVLHGALLDPLVPVLVGVLGGM